MKKLLAALVMAMGLAACGPDAVTRYNMCEASCSYPNGSCANVDDEGHAICQDGKWKMVLDGHHCPRPGPVCRVYQPNTFRGEQAKCWYEQSNCN